jgi:hypothetical protein
MERKCAASVKKEATVKIEVPVKTIAKVKNETSVKKELLVKTETQVKMEAPVRNKATVKNKVRIKMETRIKQEMRVKMEAPVKTRRVFEGDQQPPAAKRQHQQLAVAEQMLADTVQKLADTEKCLANAEEDASKLSERCLAELGQRLIAQRRCQELRKKLQIASDVIGNMKLRIAELERDKQIAALRIDSMMDSRDWINAATRNHMPAPPTCYRRARMAYGLDAKPAAPVAPV